MSDIFTGIIYKIKRQRDRRDRYIGRLRQTDVWTYGWTYGRTDKQIDIHIYLYTERERALHCFPPCPGTYRNIFLLGSVTPGPSK